MSSLGPAEMDLARAPAPGPPVSRGPPEMDVAQAPPEPGAPVSAKASNVSAEKNLTVPVADQKLHSSHPPARRRDYDLCMVFPYSAQDSRGKPDLTEIMRKQQREGVLKNLQNCGLHVFCHYSRDRDEIFCKIGANAQQLRNTAARIKYKLQLKPEYLSAYAEYRNDFPGRPEMHYTDRRLVSHIYKSHTHEEYPAEDAIFSTRDKIFLINHIIIAKERDCAGVNVGNLLESGELKAYFPLHEERALHALAENKLAFVWMSSEHADKVRDYFGEKIAFYFLFMSFYWKSLLIPAALGALCQIIDLFFRTPDNYTAVPFTLFIAVWTSLMPHFWRRQEAKYAIAFGTLDMVPEFEPCRPRFWGENRINPVTAQIEPYYPWSQRLFKYIFSGFVLVITAAVLVVLCLAYVLAEQLHEDRVFLYNFCLAVIVEVSNSWLSSMATWLNDRENHRTQSEYENSLLIKVLAFKFVNSYFVLYYIAFIKKQSWVFFGVKMVCYKNDCFLDLQAMLVMFVIVKLTLSNMAEYLIPKIFSCYRGFSERRRTVFHNMVSYNKLELADMSAPEMESKKEVYSSFDDFDETLIAHGYATLFAVASPWVCTATLLWVVLESFMDVKGLTEVRRRPLPERVRTNEPWNTAYDIYGVLGVFTNITLLVYTSERFQGVSAVYRLVLYMYLLHGVFISKWVVQALFPALPRSVELLRLKQANLVHRALENIKQDAQIQTHQDYGLLRHQTKSERIPVLDQDMHDMEAEEPEPHFSCFTSIHDLVVSLAEHLSCHTCCALICAILVSVACAVGLVLYNMQKGNELPDSPLR